MLSTKQCELYDLTSKYKKILVNLAISTESPEHRVREAWSSISSILYEFGEERLPKLVREEILRIDESFNGKRAVGLSINPLLPEEAKPLSLEEVKRYLERFISIYSTISISGR